jgi:hypothetical protein
LYRSLLTLTALLLMATGSCAGAAEFNHCSDFGCKTRQQISFSAAQWHEIEQLFAQPALSPWLEKQQIRRAIALMERFSGAMTGTFRDRGENYPGEDIPNQMDCIDESTNTLQYLAALEKRKLMHWHRVQGKKQRYRFIFAHWTAVIEERHSGASFAVDSWYRDNGEPPYIQPLEAWMDADDFPAQLNPELQHL